MHTVGRKSSVSGVFYNLVSSFRGGFSGTSSSSGSGGVYKNGVRAPANSENSDACEEENEAASGSRMPTQHDGRSTRLSCEDSTGANDHVSTAKCVPYTDVAISAEIVDLEAARPEETPVPEAVRALRRSESRGLAIEGSRSSSIGGHNRFNAQAYNHSILTSPTMANINSYHGGSFTGRRSVTLLTGRPGSSAGTEEGSIGSEERGEIENEESGEIENEGSSEDRENEDNSEGRESNENEENVAVENTAASTESERNTQNEEISEVDENGIPANEHRSADECHGIPPCNEENEPVQEISVSSRDSHSATPSASNPVSASPNEQSTASAVAHEAAEAAETAETTPGTYSGENTATKKKMDAEGFYSIRLTPFIDHASTAPYMFFGPIIRRLKPGMRIPVGRYTEKCRSAATAPQGSSAPVVFKSKVVSRHHAQLSVDHEGRWYIKDVSSSSGTFLNHVRLSLANVESGEYNLGDSDILQFGMDYRGGSEEIYRCVKVKVELNFSWRRRGAKFSKEAHERLKELTLTKKDEDLSPCVICLGPIKPCQAVFVASCSHSWHYKCIRPLIVKNYPQFMCPNCKAICDIEADLDDEDEI